MTSAERLEAALLGVAIGDALGFPFEGMPREALVGLDLSSFHGEAFPPGTWSDDTSLTFITAESLVARGRLDLEDLSRRFLHWLREGYFTPFGEAIGVGRATREALLRVERGVPPQEAGGRGERDNGNGSLMRILPLALWYAKDPLYEAQKALHLASSLTHAHPRSLIACGLFGLLVRELVAGSPLKEALLAVKEEGPNLYPAPPFKDELSHYGLFFSGKLFSLPREGIRSSGYVVDTLLSAFWVLYHTGSFREAVETAVRLGGDTDTLAAVVGGAAGFYYGLGGTSLFHGLQRKELLLKTSKDFARGLSERWSNRR